MKKTMVLFAVIAVLVVGCDWADVEKNAKAVGDVSGKVEVVGVATSPYTAGYGGLVGQIAGGIGVIALSLANFAKGKKIKAIAKAAVEAADAVDGGGKAISSTSKANNVAPIIKSAEDKYAVKG